MAANQPERQQTRLSTAADDFAVRVVWAGECVDVVNEINLSCCCHCCPGSSSSDGMSWAHSSSKLRCAAWEPLPSNPEIPVAVAPSSPKPWGSWLLRLALIDH